MAGMRPPALMLRADGAYCTFAVAPDAYPPRITGGQLVPLWKMLPAPTPANTKPGPFRGPVFSRQSTSAKSRDVVGKIRNLLIAHRRQHFGHGGVVTATRIVFVFAQCLREVFFALVGDARNIVAAGHVQAMTTVATVPGNQRACRLHARNIALFCRRLWRRKFR